MAIRHADRHRLGAKIAEELANDLVQSGEIDLACSICLKAGSLEKTKHILQKNGNVEQWKDILLEILLKVNDNGSAMALSFLLVEHFNFRADTIAECYSLNGKTREGFDFLCRLVRTRETSYDVQTKALMMAFELGKHHAEKVLAPGSGFTKFDKELASKLAIDVGLYEQGIELVENDKEQQLSLVSEYCHMIKFQWIRNSFAKMETDDQICRQLVEMKQHHRNWPVILKIIDSFFRQLNTAEMIEKVFNGDKDGSLYLHQHLTNLKKNCPTGDKVFNQFYLQSCCVSGNVLDAEMACKNTKFQFNGKQMAEFIMARKEKSLNRLLMFICDRFDLVEDMVRFFYKENELNFVEAYTAVLNPQRLPKVINVLKQLREENGGHDRNLDEHIDRISKIVPQNSLFKRLI